MIDELVSASAEFTGLPAPKVRRALSAALGLLDKHAAPAKLEELYGAVPGARDMARAPGSRPKGGGGLFGGIMKSAGGVSGAAMADAMGVLDGLKRDGIDKADLKALLPIAMTFVRERTGRDLLREVVESLPGVGTLLAGR